ncbi:MAG: SpoIID/LytB domain-containing protein [Cyanobacteriota bacterium]|nr:SpoIID/LytB domain-containing protein [Cyanobacteriota bacterium]
MSVPPLTTALNRKSIALKSTLKNYPAKIKPNHNFTINLTAIFTTTIFILAISANSAFSQSTNRRWLQIGIVQKFGEKTTDKLTLKATPEDKLNLRFKTMEGEGSLSVDSVTLQIKTKPLEKPLLRERLVLSSHRSFESAEESASKWQELGIKVEISQPGRWKVWADREVYTTPLLRRWLLQTLQARGHNSAYLDVEIVKEKKVAYWQTNGLTYHRHELDIVAGKSVILVNGIEGEEGDRLYGGTLRLQPNAYGTYTLVNNVPLETYLRGVVPHELGAWPPQASLEAQAIIARTYALRNLRRFQADNYELCANTHCQVYKGLDVYPQTDKAIAATKGLVLTYENELVDAVYFATSGGVTADFNDVWDGPGRPYLQPTIDSANNIWNLSANSLASEPNFRRFMSIKKGFNEDGWVDFRWREQLSLQGVAGNLKSYLREKKSTFANLKTVKEMRVLERSRSGRVLKMLVETDLGPLLLEKDEVQNALWAPWSTLFYLDPIYDGQKNLQGYAIVGGGFGHGVGFSQKGSIKLAELGWSSDRILEFYFPGTQVQPLSNEITFGSF